jgi:hypothetical protein
MDEYKYNFNYDDLHAGDFYIKKNKNNTRIFYSTLTDKRTSLSNIPPNIIDDIIEFQPTLSNVFEELNKLLKENKVSVATFIYDLKYQVSSIYGVHSNEYLQILRKIESFNRNKQRMAGFTYPWLDICKNYNNKIVSWLINEAFKNEKLPYLPQEMWDYILTFIPKNHRWDYIIPFNPKYYQDNAFTMCNGVYMFRLGEFGRTRIRYNVQHFINNTSMYKFRKIKPLSFNSDKNDKIMSNSIDINHLEILFKMDDYMKSELIQILDKIRENRISKKNLDRILQHISRKKELKVVD